MSVNAKLNASLPSFAAHLANGRFVPPSADWPKNLKQYPVSNDLNSVDWANLLYYPAPKIVEATQALYQEHQVNDITHSDTGAYHLTLNNQALNKIIDFVTGVPGASKTFSRLNIANQYNESPSRLGGNYWLNWWLPRN